MPIAKFQMPDGRVARFEVPDGTTPDQAEAMIQEAISGMSKPEPKKFEITPEMRKQAYREAAQDMPWLQRNIAAMATPVAGAVESVKSWFGKGDVEEQQRIAALQEEAPIGAMVPYVAGSLATIPAGLMTAGAQSAGLATRVLPAAKTAIGRVGLGAAGGAVGGLFTPTEQEQAGIGDVAGKVAKGAAVGAAATGVGEGVFAGFRGFRNLVTPILSKQEANKAASRLILSSIKGKEDDVIDLIKSGKIDETAFQAAASANTPEFQYIADVLTKKNFMAGKFGAINDAQEKARLEMFSRIARGSSAEQSMASRDTMRQNLEKALGGVREAELEAAGTAGKVIAKLGPQADAAREGAESAVQGVRDFTAAGGRAAERAATTTTVPGYPRVPGRYTYMGELEQAAEQAAQQGADLSMMLGDKARFLERQIGSLEEHGLRPLSVEPILNRITYKLGQKTTKVNDPMRVALEDIASKFRIAAEGGVVDPKALYEIRKTGINQAFADLVNTQKLSKEQAAHTLKELRPMIDDAIENAGGTEWKSYVRKYFKGFEAIDRVELMDKARQLYKQNPEKFVDFVKGENPELVQQIMTGTYKVRDALPKQFMDKLDDIVYHVERDERIKTLVGRGAEEGKMFLKASETANLPGIFNQVVTVAKNIYRRLEGKGSKQIELSFAELMLPENKPLLAKMLAAAKPDERVMIIKARAALLGSGAYTGQLGARE